MTRAPRCDWSFLPAAAVPGQHGAYLIRDATGSVLYVGHTSHLRRRLAKGHRYTATWYARMASIDFIPCDGVDEARVLEKALIALHRPAANLNDVLTEPAPRHRLPDRHVARLVELYEACADAPLRDREAQDDALDGYIAGLRRDGWTFRAIGHALTMTRQAIHQRLGRATVRHADLERAA